MELKEKVDITQLEVIRSLLFQKNFSITQYPFNFGKYENVINFEFVDSEILMTLNDGKKVNLKEKEKYIGYMDKGEGAYGLLFKNNNLHFEIQIDKNHPIGQEDPAGIKDILMESAITTIQDCEDSVAAVDDEDKIIVYRNWLGLMKGNLKEHLKKVENLLPESLILTANTYSKMEE